jgi:rubrerythrin
MNATQSPPTGTGDRRSTKLRDSPMMAHLMDALERGEDISHYGRLTFAIVARHFLPEPELLRLLGNCPAHGAAEAQELLADVTEHDYVPPTPETIRAWQAHQSFPICPNPDYLDACNVYHDLLFPERVYGHLEEYHVIAEKERNTMSKTDENLQAAITGEARARLKYTAFAMQAMREGHPEIAQLFLEAAGAETIHGISHLRVAGGIGTTEQNLDEAAKGEDDEIEKLYPRMICEAEAERRQDAAASFRLAAEREKHHRAMFQEAFRIFRT